MCRHLAYLGPPVPLSSLVLEPPHSLAHQSWAPRDMRGGGTINADGFGIGWYTPSGPIRYRRDRPIWSDLSLPDLAGVTTSGAILAAVRSATAGMVQWLQQDYGLTLPEAAIVLGSAVQYSVANLAGRSVGVAAKVDKRLLPAR